MAFSFGFSLFRGRVNDWLPEFWGRIVRLLHDVSSYITILPASCRYGIDHLDNVQSGTVHVPGRRWQETAVPLH